MSYELNKLMQQYGITTPGAALYSGSTDADKSAYDTYASEYANRIGTGSPYSQAQFQSLSTPTYAAYSPTYTQPAGVPVPPPVTMNTPSNALGNIAIQYPGGGDTEGEPGTGEPATGPGLTGGQLASLGLSALGGPLSLGLTVASLAAFGKTPSQLAFSALANAFSQAPSPVSTPAISFGLGVEPEIEVTELSAPIGYGVEIGALEPASQAATEPGSTEPGSTEPGSTDESASSSSSEDSSSSSDDDDSGGAGDDDGGGGDDGGGDMAMGGLMRLKRYGHGGKVKTHYQEAGEVVVPTVEISQADDFSLADKYFPPEVQLPAAVDDRREFNRLPSPVNAVPQGLPSVALPIPSRTQAPYLESYAPATAQPPAPAGREQVLQDLLAKYGPGASAYGPELQAARAKSQTESDAFQKMLMDAMASKENEKSSQSEMYFRLAAAFGAPTKTGHFMENVGLAGKEMSAHAAGQRDLRRENLALALKGQELRVASAKDDLTTLRSLSSEEMKDKRAIATELIKEYVKSGEAHSTAGKQAQDEGFVQGTPEYQKRVAAIGDANMAAKSAQIDAALGNLSATQAQLALAQQRFQHTQEQATKLTSAEMKLKTDTEDGLAQSSSAYTNLKRALELNPNTFDSSVADIAQRKILEAAGSKNPKVVNTREMENLLQKAALSQLKETFPGAISNDERRALMAVQGIEAKSIEERKIIMQSAAAALRTSYARSKKRLDDINAGKYRVTIPERLD